MKHPHNTTYNLPVERNSQQAALVGSLRASHSGGPSLPRLRLGTMHRTYLLLVGFLVSACATTEPSSFAALEAEVTAHIHEGMMPPEAIAALTSRGFSCNEGTALRPRDRGIFECTRSRGPLWPPYACMHRVSFDAPTASATISKLQVFNPACASL